MSGACLDTNLPVEYLEEEMIMEPSKTLVAVIGAGPAGIYASHLLAQAGAHVALLNRDVKPGGLAEYGIYYDKYKMKEGLRQQFRKIIHHPQITYFGNAPVGAQASLSLDDLRSLGFHARLVTVGAQGTKWLGLPGEFLSGVYHAKDLVYHFNQLPPFSQRRYEIGKRVALVGVGNVMVDIARWLIRDLKVEQVIALARRGPAEMKFTRRELESIICNLDLKAFDAELERCAPVMEASGQSVQEAHDFVRAALPQQCETGSSTRFLIKFLSAPSAILDDGSGRASGLEVDETTLLLREDGETFAKPTGSRRVEDVDTVIFCIGDRVDESFGLPVRWNEYVKNPEPRFPVDGISYEVFDPQLKTSVPDVFVAGWARKASDGLVGKARKDGENGARAVLQYLESAHLPEVSLDQALGNLEMRLRQTGKPLVTKADWQRLEGIEKTEAVQRNLEIFKYDSNDEMFAAMGLIVPARVRLLQPAEYAEWQRLRRELWPSCSLDVHAQEMHAIIQDFTQNAVFVSPSPHGGLQGFLEVSLRNEAEGCETARVGYMEGLYVESRTRQRGIARALVQAAEAWARSKGCTEIASDTELENLNSQYIHKRLGFQEVGRLVHYKKSL